MLVKNYISTKMKFKSNRFIFKYTTPNIITQNALDMIQNKRYFYYFFKTNKFNN
jgi:hypothetical protein